MKEALIEGLLEGGSIILLALITYLSNYIAKKIGMYLDEKGLNEELNSKKYMADIVVNAVEQIYVTEGGPQKFEEAKDRLLHLAKVNGINITNEELDMFIEDAVKSMKSWDI